MSQGKTQMAQGAFASLRYRKTRDRIIELILLMAGLVAVFTTVAIVFILFYESSFFFEHVSVKDFVTDTMWTPLFADARYGIMPLVSGTLTVTGVAILVAIPVGTVIAIYLSEFAPHKLRESVKPVLELLSAVGHVVQVSVIVMRTVPTFSAIALLPDAQRRPLVLMGAYGFSQLEVADACGCTVGTVKSRCFRGRAKLAERLDHLRNPEEPDAVVPPDNGAVTTTD
jgi:ABC-type phosphate transport system permease subunit